MFSLQCLKFLFCLFISIDCQSISTKKPIEQLILHDIFPQHISTNVSTTRMSSIRRSPTMPSAVRTSRSTRLFSSLISTIPSKVVTEASNTTATTTTKKASNTTVLTKNTTLLTRNTTIQSNTTILSTILTKSAFITTTTTSGSIKNGTIITTSGNSNGANCYFPFIYKGKLQNKCIDKETVDANGAKTQVKFCSTTDNFDRDTKWGLCLDYTACHFPFVFDGQIYSNCISNYLSPNFCSTTANFDTDKKWAQCPVVCLDQPERNAHVVRFNVETTHKQPCQFKDYFSKYNGLKLRTYAVGKCQLSYVCEQGYRRLYDEIECKLDGSYDKTAYCISENFFN